MIVFKVLVQGIISSVILVYLDDFHDSLINVVRKLGEKEILVIACGFHGHVGSDPENYEDQHGGYGYWARNTKRERIFEFSVTMNMTVGNTLFKKSAKTLVDYCLVRRN